MDDRIMLVLVRELLDRPDEHIEHTLKSEVLRALLARLRDLLEREIAARRPSHRPREDTGESVARLYEACGDLAKARRLVAKMEGKTQRAVAAAHQRYQKRMRQK